MKNLFSFTTRLVSGSLMACLFFTYAEATNVCTKNLQVGLDGSSKIAAVWEATYRDQPNGCIQASYGLSLSEDVIYLTDAKLFVARKPIMATSASTMAPTKAAAIWIAKDLTTNHEVIQVSTLTALGWNNKPVTLSCNDGSEEPTNNYGIIISEDGKTIVANWSSFFSHVNGAVSCCAVSTNGGLTWMPPEQLLINSNK